MQQADALIRKDIDQCNLERTELVAQAIHLLMQSARMGLVQNNPGAVVGAVSQLDKLCGLSPPKRSSLCIRELIGIEFGCFASQDSVPILENLQTSLKLDSRWSLKRDAVRSQTSNGV